MTTTEEVLEHVRRNARERLQQSIETARLNSEDANRANFVADRQDKSDDGTTQGTPRRSEGRNGIDESVERSDGRVSDKFHNGVRAPGVSNSSIDEYQFRPTITNTTGKPTKVKSKFRPYIDAIKKSVTEKKEKKKAPPKQQRRISELEQEERKKKLIRGLLLISDHMDESIQATTKGHRPVYIWSALDNQGAEVLAVWMIRHSKHSQVIASTVDMIIDLENDIEAATLIAPMVYKTFATYFTRGISIKLTFGED